MNLYAALVLSASLLTAPHQAPAAPVASLHIEEAQAVKPKNIVFPMGIDLIVRGLGLNIDHIRFIKEPLATDYCVNADNNAPYARSIIIAANNGIKLDRNMKMNKKLTRAEFALYLFEAINATGNYPVNMMWLLIKDEAAFPPDALSAVQTLVKFKVVTLENGRFRPNALITLVDAEKMVKNAAAFVKAHKAQSSATPQPTDEVTFTTTPVNEHVNRVVISRGEKPNSGYQIIVTSIVFPEKGAAVIHYKLTDPAPDHSYLQVITTPTVETFVAADCKVTLQEDK
jgi:hypothetical protein